MDDNFHRNYTMLSAHTHSMDLPMSSIHKPDINYGSVHKSDINYPIVHKTDVNFTSPYKTDVSFTNEHKSDVNFPSVHKTELNFPSVHKSDVNFSSVHDTVGRCSPLSSPDTKVSFGFTQEQVECVCEVSVKFNAFPLGIYVIFNIDNFINTFNLQTLLTFQML